MSPRSTLAKKTLALLLGAIVLSATSGCVVSPTPVYVAPTYVSPGIGWVWEFHTSYGWGWHHPQHGWHRGWR